MSRRPVSVALVEVPAIDVELDGESLLEDFTLNHPKYQQLVLAANLRRAPGVDVTLVDLKGGGDPERVCYGHIDYCGWRLDLWRVGVPFDRAAETLARADVVGISANFTIERAAVARTIAHVRALPRRPVIVVGGHDATADPSYYLRRGADLCVLGEGETALQEIASAVGRGAGLEIAGTVSRAGAVPRRSDRRRPHRYEDIVFPDIDLLAGTHFDQSPDGPFPPDVAPRLASLETSRGCPEACSFCDVSFIVGGHRPVPFDALVERLRAFRAAGIRTVQVIDDNLLYRTLPAYEGERGRRAILDLFALLYEQGFAWEFFNGFQLALFERDGVMDEELIGALYRHGKEDGRHVGCFRSYVPIDKVTPAEMSRLRKLKSLDVTRAVVSAVAERGVPALVLGFVIGSVRETADSLEETALRAEEFAAIVRRSSGGRTLAPVLPLCSVPLPGTPDFRTWSDHIAFPPDRYPELYNIFVSVVRTDHFTPRALTERRQEMRDALNRDAGPVVPPAPR
jgi:radical SAM superfamily enzyme YgiQ (UPF0313 family)